MVQGVAAYGYSGCGVVQELIAFVGLGAIWAQEWNGSVQCDKRGRTSDEWKMNGIEMQKGSGGPGNQPRKERGDAVRGRARLADRFGAIGFVRID